MYLKLYYSEVSAHNTQAAINQSIKFLFFVSLAYTTSQNRLMRHSKR